MTMQQPQLHLNDLPSGVLHKIFNVLPARDLCSASCTCTLWRKLNVDAASNAHWHSLYTAKWHCTHGLTEHHERWQVAYGAKMQSLKVYRSGNGRFDADMLYGHRAGVRCIQLLTSQGLAFSGGKDQVLHMWDLECGQLMGTSTVHGGLIRSIAVDDHLLVSSASDGAVRMWFASSPGRGFALGSRPRRLASLHKGPVSSVGLAPQVLVTGSWDTHVRIWDRKTLTCQQVLGCKDWVSAVMPRTSLLHVHAGSTVYSWDFATGYVLSALCSPEGQAFAAAEASWDGKTVFTAIGRSVHMHDLRCRAERGDRLLYACNSEVSALSFEHPWLAVGATDGNVVLVDSGGAGGPGHAGTAASTPRVSGPAGQPPQVSAHVRRGFSMQGSAVCSVALADGWLAAAAQDQPVLRSWHFMPTARARGNGRRVLQVNAHTCRRQCGSCRKACCIDIQPSSPEAVVAA